MISLEKEKKGFQNAFNIIKSVFSNSIPNESSKK